MDVWNCKKAIRFILIALGSAFAVFSILALIIWAASVVPVDMNPPVQQINHNNYAERASHE